MKEGNDEFSGRWNVYTEGEGAIGHASGMRG
jgi:hypothetical protein